MAILLRPWRPPMIGKSVLQMDNCNGGGEPHVPRWMRSAVAEVFTVHGLTGSISPGRQALSYQGSSGP
jgi:hypothetical protein